VVAANGLQGRVTVIKGKVESVALPVPQVDIIVCNFMGPFLLGGGMLPSLLYARDRCARVRVRVRVCGRPRPQQPPWRPSTPAHPPTHPPPAKHTHCDTPVCRWLAPGGLLFPDRADLLLQGIDDSAFLAGERKFWSSVQVRLGYGGGGGEGGGAWPGRRPRLVPGRRGGRSCAWVLCAVVPPPSPPLEQCRARADRGVAGPVFAPSHPLM
jgi:hypothetical protein